MKNVSGLTVGYGESYLEEARGKSSQTGNKQKIDPADIVQRNAIRL